MATASPVYAQATTLTEPAKKERIASIDILRGLVMVIMAIDHVRDFYHAGHPEPTDLAHTDLFLFYTRWITHFCAPAFVLLSGLSAYLAGKRRTKAQFRAFLIKRGLWLIGVELVFITLAITLNPLYNVFVFQVIWAIGGSMILLGLLIDLPMPAIFTIGAILVFGHNIFDRQLLSVHAVNDTVAGKLLLSGTGFGDFVPFAANRGILTAYALLPWAGIMFIGYVFGSMYVKTFDAVKRRQILLYAGLAVLAIFFVLRFFNIYGDPNPWASQKTASLSIISFFNVTKYPPSLLYTCMTVGATLLGLASLEHVKNRFTSILYVYGNVPFFYYLCHWYLIKLCTIPLFFIQGFKTSDIINPNLPILFYPDKMGFSLFWVYVIWLCVILILYYPCRWYSNYKRSHTQWWLSYL
ncbi:MAG TPA: heparan-alpha-glucosaminide N-acetyltransferase domain-containing protein [Mucilaginibacter sp.]|jgi:uncharacterized membrane protein|nr:heparan-alpha-glucosaminide N-acetyltransferase domain-containing protein [Mucilaginibacter sp.]